ncbi:MAG: hypothetical protein AB7U75_22635 [Hyphomicrobiaceae bacterium]
MPNLIVSMILLYVAGLLMPRPKSQAPAPGEPGNIAIAKEGSPIAVVFGRPVIKAQNTVWYGDLRADPIRKEGGKK